MEEHDKYMFSILEVLNKNDLVFILGDMLFDGPNYELYLERLRHLKCRIRFIMGNHDSLKLLKEGFLEHRAPLANYKGMWLSHCPIHPQEMRNRTGCVHGHLHSGRVLKDSINQFLDKVIDHRYFNVNIEDNNYQLVPLDTIKTYFKGYL